MTTGYILIFAVVLFQDRTLRDRWNGMEFAPDHISVWDTGMEVGGGREGVNHAR